MVCTPPDHKIVYEMFHLKQLSKAEPLLARPP
jgi:hypothetical protein